ncbi:type II secretion system F family protein [Georgenia sp. MJ170]|uniref:type II secretion system F family protein n=2 Tax=Georgenia sunbinii TaxID=3117728 RepID=UPI002F2683C2
MVMLLVLGVLAVLPWWLGRMPVAQAPADRASTDRQGPDGRRRWPSRRGARVMTTAPDPAVVLDLVDVALAAGASIPDALHGLGVALAPGRVARDLTTASAALRLGASWRDAWSGAAAAVEPLAAALEPAWLDGADPGPLVRRAAAGVRARRQRAAREAAERLGATLVLPLGLCFLPAFVLLSLVPVLLSGSSSLLGG